MKLFNMFNSTSEVVIAPQEPKKSQSSLVKEIHDSFNNSIDAVLEQAGIIKSKQFINEELEEKVKILKSLGFTNTQQVKDLEIIVSNNKNIQYQNDKNKQVIEDIKYFKQKYPHYKIIDQLSLQKVCNKYQLMYGHVTFFKGNIPDKNFQDLKNFKIDEEDKLYIAENGWGRNQNSYLADCKLTPKKGEHNYTDALLIAAPVTDFNLSAFDNSDRTKYGQLKAIVDKDPIVLQPVYRNNKSHYNYRNDYYIIVTAWGDEASDSSIVNEKMN